MCANTSMRACVCVCVHTHEHTLSMQASCVVYKTHLPGWFPLSDTGRAATLSSAQENWAAGPLAEPL